MQFNTESILALGDAMIYYTGQKSLDSLDISYNYIKNQGKIFSLKIIILGIALLRKSLILSVRAINIKELNLSRNYIDQEGLEDLEDVIDSLYNPYEIDLSNNNIKEFTQQSLL